MVCFVFLATDARQELSNQRGFLDITVTESLIQIPAVALLGGRPGDGDSAEEDVGRLGKTSPTLLHHPGAAAPCNTPNIRKKRTRKKHKTEKAQKTEVVRFASQEKDLINKTPDLIPAGRKPYWSTDVEVTHLEFSEQNYRRNKITDSLFAGSVHIGYSLEEEQKDGSCEEQVSEFTSWRELFDRKMENSV